MGKGQDIEFITKLPDEIKQRLIRVGLIEHSKFIDREEKEIVHLASYRKIKSRNGHQCYEATSGLLSNYVEHLKAAEKDSAYIKQIVSHCVQILRHSNFEFPEDICVSPVEQFLVGLRKKNKSARTINSFRVDFSCFCNWMINEEYLSYNPIKRIKNLNVDADRRLVRRALAPKQITMLLESTKQSEAHNGLSGEERALAYWLTIETGCRWTELYNIKREKFCFEHPAHIILEAKHTKNKSEAQIPLRDSIAQAMKVYFGNKLKGKVFEGMWKKRGYVMLKRDLKTAGIPVETEEGVVDFHSLRATTATLLSQSGIMPDQTRGAYAAPQN